MKLPKGIRVAGRSYVAYVTKDGKPIRKVIGVVGCSTIKQMVEARFDLIRQVREGLYPPPSQEAPAPATPVITCRDLWDEYKKDCVNRDVRRMDRLELAWSHLLPVFGSKPAVDVKPKDIADYVSSRREAGMANGTCNREIAILKASFRHGARLELIERIPAFPRKLKEAKPRQGFIEESQYRTLMSKTQEPWLRCFLGLGFNFGMRKSEMLNLRVSDVDLLDGWLTVSDSKNGDSRRAKLTQETMMLLTECIRGKKEDGYVLTREDGSRVAQPRKDWYSLCVASGLGVLDDKGRYKGLQMHDLRRSAARRLVKDYHLPEKTVMALCGWKTRSVFDRYSIVNERDLEQAASRMDGQKPVSGVENRHKTDSSGFAHS